MDAIKQLFKDWGNELSFKRVGVFVLTVVITVLGYYGKTDVAGLLTAIATALGLGIGAESLAGAKGIGESKDG